MPGSVWDLTILFSRINEHIRRTEKYDDETELSDHGLLREQYSDQWSPLLDKGYQSAYEEFKELISYRKSP